MGRRELKTNYLIALLNLILFIIFFCFVFEFTKAFLEDISNIEGFKLWLLFLGGVLPLIIHNFIANLDYLYKKVQHFFFRDTILYNLLPSFLVLFIIGYFVIPKLLNLSFNKDIFVFIGGYLFTTHLIFTAEENKSSNFTGFINYLFIFALLYTINLLLLILYLRIGYIFDIKSILILSLRNGYLLIKSLIVPFMSTPSG